VRCERGDECDHPRHEDERETARDHDRDEQNAGALRP
jgi:hypothetical protein